MYGELVPIGGGDAIPLLKANLLVGRRESCDIVLRFGNVSGQHCELTLDRGWWFVKDSGSQNGTRVNGLRVSKKRLDPGDRLTIARNDYEVRYSPAANGGDDSIPPEDDVFADIMGRSLLESAGLDRRKFHERDGRVGVRRRGPAAAPESDSGDVESNDPTSDENPLADGDMWDDQIADDQTADDQTADDQTADDQTAGDETTREIPTGEQTSRQETAKERAAGDPATTERPSGDAPALP